MHFRNSGDSYGIIAQSFHWLIALMIFIPFGIGVYASGLPMSLARLQWLSHHKALGITILVLVLLRLMWRVFNRPPPLPASMPRWERRAAVATHWGIYALLIAAPLAGWLYASAAGLSVSWFGVVNVPDLVAKNPELAPTMRALHSLLVKTLAVLLVLHIAAATRHALLLRDGVMRRMLPRWRKKP
jgi:cytochrome b561